ncbi:acylphosphatase [Chloroflexota bacterium]
MDNQKTETVRLHVIIEGRVQGVGFRYFVEDNARSLDLTGWVRNRWNRTVEVMAEGKRENAEKLLMALYKGPRSAIVSEIKSAWRPASGEFHSFQIRRTID